jgi:hypothetical protein
MICTHCQQEQAEHDGLCEACLEIEPDMVLIAPTEEQIEIMAHEIAREETHYAKHHAQGCR